MLVKIVNQSYVIYKNEQTKERIEVQTPLNCLVNVTDLKNEIGIPDYTDLNNFQMTKTVVALWSFNHPEKVIHGPNVEPIKAALFGGAAFKLACPSSNKGPLSRDIGDVDFVTLRENGKRLIEILCNLGDKCGSMFLNFVPEADKRFNALRTGMRYRVRTIKQIETNGTPILGPMDIFCDKLPFCHTINVQADLSTDVVKHSFTIGLENLIISKSQFIKCVSKSETFGLDKNRIMGEYDKNHVLIGMEIKDMKDVTAAILDHDLGNGPGNISMDILGGKLREDWKIWRTVAMNLNSLNTKLVPILNGFGVERDDQKIIAERLAKMTELLEGKYAAKKKVFVLGKQWWEDVEDQTQPSAHM